MRSSTTNVHVVLQDFEWSNRDTSTNCIFILEVSGKNDSVRTVLRTAPQTDCTEAHIAISIMRKSGVNNYPLTVVITGNVVRMLTILPCPEDAYTVVNISREGNDISIHYWATTRSGTT